MPTFASPLFRQLTDSLSPPVAQDLQDCVLGGDRDHAVMLIIREGFSPEDAALLFEQCLERWSGVDVDMVEVPLAAMRETIEARERAGVSGGETSPYLVRYGTSILPARVTIHRGKVEMWAAPGRLVLDSVRQFWLVNPKPAVQQSPAQPKRQSKHAGAPPATSAPLAEAPAPDVADADAASPAAAPSERPRPVLRAVPASHYVDDDCAPTEADGPPAFLWTRHHSFVSTPATGKWCVVRPAEEIDALWAKVREAVLAGQYPAALVSSRAQAAEHGGTYVICLFTPDWTDGDQVLSARDFLRSIGVEEEIGYKRDIETVRNVYGTPDEFIYRT
jgi:hypothetical protein